jgi:hypothetical protein
MTNTATTTLYSLSIYLYRNLETTLKVWCYVAFIMVLIWWVYLTCFLGYGLLFHCKIHHATWKKSPFLLSLYSNNALTYLDYWLVQATVDYSVSLLMACWILVCLLHDQTHSYLAGGGYYLAVMCINERANLYQLWALRICEHTPATRFKLYHIK